MQMLTINDLKTKGLEYLNAGNLGARNMDGCVYERGNQRCIAGATFNDETMAAIRYHKLNDGVPVRDLEIIKFCDTRTACVYDASQMIHDAWAIGAPLKFTASPDYLTPAEATFLDKLRGTPPTLDDLRQWLTLIS